MGFLLSSFQQPQDKTVIRNRMEWHRQNQNLDSLVYYQNLLLKIVEREANSIEKQSVGEFFLAMVMPWDKPTLEQKEQFLKNNPLSKSWKYSYQTQLQLEQGRTDSAYFYLGLLKAEASHSEALIYAHSLFATNFIKNKNYKEAYTQLQYAENLAKNTTDSILLYPVQAEVYSAIGFWEEAGNIIEKQIYIQKNKKYKNNLEISLLYQKLADLELKQEHFAKAREYYVKSSSYVGDKDSDFNILLQYQIGFCWTKLGREPKESLLYLHKILKFLGENQNKKNTDLNAKITTEVYCLMASEFAKNENLDSAKFYLEKALSISKKQSNLLEEIWVVQSQMQMQQKQWLEAENTLYKMIDGASKKTKKEVVEIASYWHLLGKVYFNQQKLQQAQTAFDKGLGLLCLQPISNKEIPNLEAMLPHWQTVKILNSKTETMLALYEKSIYHVSLKDIYFYARTNVQLLQQISDVSSISNELLTTIVQAYEQSIEACLLLYEHYRDKTYLEQAFHLSEQFKEWQLNEQLKEPLRQEFGEVPQATIQLESQYQKKICRYKEWLWEMVQKKDSVAAQWHRELIATFQANQEILQHQIAQKYPKYYDWKYNNTIAKIDSIQQIISNKTALVQYLEGEKFVYQFLIKKDSFAYRRITWNAYKPTVLKFYKHFTDNKLMQHSQSGSYKDFCMTSYELYHKVLHHELFDNSQELVIVPDGLLSYIPFETLLTDIPLDSVHKINFPSLSFLLKQKNISYNYSVTNWLKSKTKKHPVSNEILAMGATYKEEQIPKFRTFRQQTIRKNLPPLENTFQEIDSLAVRYAGNFYTNRYATEYYLKNYAPNYGILHLAFHVMIDQEHIENTSLILAEDAYEEEDNFLNINEIKQLNMNASLVVLSNLPTAYGQQQRGEGILALIGSFMYAGTSAIVLSLWQEPEDAKAEIMDYFYKNLKNKMPKDEALRQAKLSYLKSAKGMQAHPVYWANYVQIGDNQAIEISEPVTYIWWFVFPIAFIGFLGWWSMRALRQR